MNPNTQKHHESLNNSNSFEKIGEEMGPFNNTERTSVTTEHTDKKIELSRLFNKANDLAKSTVALKDSHEKPEQTDDYSAYERSVAESTRDLFDKSLGYLANHSGVTSEIDDCENLLYEKNTLLEKKDWYGKSIPGLSIRSKIKKINKQLERYDDKIIHLADRRRSVSDKLASRGMHGEKATRFLSEGRDVKDVAIRREINYAKITNAMGYSEVKRRLRQHGYKKLPMSVDDPNFTTKELDAIANIADTAMSAMSHSKKN